jgi:hypothetical protein
LYKIRRTKKSAAKAPQCPFVGKTKLASLFSLFKGHFLGRMATRPQGSDANSTGARLTGRQFDFACADKSRTFAVSDLVPEGG